MPKATTRPKARAYGRYKLGVTFYEHKSTVPYYFRSDAKQDRQNKSIARLRWLIETKWTGRVAWACIYENEQPLIEFHGNDNEWRDASDQQTISPAAARPQGEAQPR